MPREVGAALLATAEGYTPRATKLLDEAREQLGSIQEIAAALADDLPAPKTGPTRTRRRRRRRRKLPGEAGTEATVVAAVDGSEPPQTGGRRRGPARGRGAAAGAGGRRQPAPPRSPRPSRAASRSPSPRARTRPSETRRPGTAPAGPVT